MSIVHFAREWRAQLSDLAAWSASALVVALPASTHPAEVSSLSAALAGDQIIATKLVVFASWATLPLTLALALGLLTNRSARHERVMLAALGVAGTMLSPLHAFAIFFALIHAPRHMASEAVELGEKLVDAWRLAIPMTAAALLMFAGLCIVSLGRIK